MKKSKKKATKKKKLTSIPVIQRRLFRLASQRCRENAHFTCEICGTKKGDTHPNTGNIQRVEAHHIMSRSNKDSLLKFDQRNLICLCTSCHKTGQFSAHKHGIWFAEWLRTNKPDQYYWILSHSDTIVNLKDRKILEWIEYCLRHNKPMNRPEEKQEKQLEFKLRV